MAHGLVAAPEVTFSHENNHKKTRTLRSLRVFLFGVKHWTGSEAVYNIALYFLMKSETSS